MYISSTLILQRKYSQLISHFTAPNGIKRLQNFMIILKDDIWTRMDEHRALDGWGMGVSSSSEPCNGNVAGLVSLKLAALYLATATRAARLAHVGCDCCWNSESFKQGCAVFEKWVIYIHYICSVVLSRVSRLVQRWIAKVLSSLALKSGTWSFAMGALQADPWGQSLWGILVLFFEMPNSLWSFAISDVSQNDCWPFFPSS